MTIDKSRRHPAASPALPAVLADNPSGTLPDFTPVPRKYNRHDGWTPDRQRRFIEALADSGSVKRAAHAVNMTPEGAYLLRRHPKGGEFRAAWEAEQAETEERSEAEIYASINRKLNDMRGRMTHEADELERASRSERSASS